MPLLATFLSILIISLASLVGIVLLSLNDVFLKRIIFALVGFSTGTLLGSAFLHLLPEAVGGADNLLKVFGIVLLGMLVSFVIENLIHWRHCHSLDCEGHNHKPVGTMILIGDGLHNVLDGILIASSYLVSIPIGIATTVAVLSHEIPQEIGDFAVLLHSGYGKKKALLWNFLSACTAFIGALLALLLAHSVHNVEMIILPLAAGHFLYIAGSDLIPEMHKEPGLKKSSLQLLAMLAGIALMYAMSGGGHEGIL